METSMTDSMTPDQRLKQTEELLQRSVELRQDLGGLRKEVLTVLRRVDSFLATRPVSTAKHEDNTSLLKN